MDRFTSKQPGESGFRAFDFTEKVGSATVTSATVSAKIVATGVDATATITTVAKQVITSPIVYVWVTAGTTNTDYMITCTATCSDTSVYELEGLIFVAESPLTAEAAGTGPGLVVAPILEPISLDELKQHARIDTHDDDSLLTDIIQEAREHVENVTKRALLTQTWDYCLPAWPSKNYFTLPFGNLQSVTSVKYKDEDGTETSLTENTDYLVTKNGWQQGRITLPYGECWPSDTLYPSNPITVRFVCGWTAARLIPASLRKIIKLVATDYYENREAWLCTGQPLIPNKVLDDLLWEWRLWALT